MLDHRHRTSERGMNMPTKQRVFPLQSFIKEAPVRKVLQHNTHKKPQRFPLRAFIIGFSSVAALASATAATVVIIRRMREQPIITEAMLEEEFVVKEAISAGATK
jgi:hypothetical protein